MRPCALAVLTPLLICAAIALAPDSAGGATPPRPVHEVHHVPAEYATIAQAFAIAAPGDTVRLAPGTHYESGLNMPLGVTLDSANGDPYTTVIDGGSARARILTCVGVTDCTIRAIGFQNGSDSIGGAIYAHSSAGLTLDYCLFESNTASVVGGAVAYASSTPQIYGCTFTGNRATVNGGALYLEYTDGSVMGCNFDQNEADAGGGAFIQYLGTTTSFTECSFADNVALDDASGGGGVFVGTQAAPFFLQCRFDRNSAAYGGGAYLGTKVEAQFTNCEFEDNTALYDGGGVRCDDDETVFIGCGFLGNSATAFYGGGFHALDSNAVLGSSWFSGNDAPKGGAISIAYNCNVLVTNCTIAENATTRSSEGAGVYVWGTSSSATIEYSIIAFNRVGEAVYCESPATATLSCCCLFENDGGDWVGCIAGQDLLNGNMTADPNFCGMFYDDLYLCADSPCLWDSPSNDCGVQIGAFDEGCAACGSAIEPLSWGRLKAIYR